MVDDLVSPLGSRFSVIRPELLQRMAVLEELDSEAILAARMSKFVALWDENDPPSAAGYDVDALEFDPAKILQELGTFFEVLLRNRVNQATRAITLAFATGTDLDAIASRYPGGVPRMDSEGYDLQGDDRYRRRIWLSPNILTPHGTPEAYIFWALNSDALYRDASAFTKAGTGNIYIPVLNNVTDLTPYVKALTEDVWVKTYTVAPVPSLQQRLATLKYIQDKSRKGLTDVVNVIEPKVVHTTYDVEIETYPGVDKTTTMNDVNQALLDLVETRRWLGNDHLRVEIGCAADKQGVYNVNIISPPADVKVGNDGFVIVDSITTRYKGVSE